MQPTESSECVRAAPDTSSASSLLPLPFPQSHPLSASESMQSSATNGSLVEACRSLLLRLLSLFALLLGAVGGGSLLLDTVQLLNHEGSRDSGQ